MVRRAGVPANAIRSSLRLDSRGVRQTDLGFAGRCVLVVRASAGIGFATAALLVSSTRFIELDAAVWSNNTER